MNKYKPIGKKRINGVNKIIYNKKGTNKQYVMYKNKYIRLVNYRKIMKAKMKKNMKRRGGSDNNKILETPNEVVGYSTSGIVPYQVLKFPVSGGKKKRGGTVAIPGTQLPLNNTINTELYISQPHGAMDAPSSIIPFSNIFKTGGKKSKSKKSKGKKV